MQVRHYILQMTTGDVMLHRRPQGNRISRHFACWLLIVVAFTAMGWAQGASNAEQRTARQFESVRRQPSLLFDFLRQMPKGATCTITLPVRSTQRASFVGRLRTDCAS